MNPYEQWLNSTPGYADRSETNQTFRLRAALDRDSRLNAAERQVYEDTECELIYGPGFFRRAHP